MKIYAFIFILSCCMFEHAHPLNWKEIILIHQQIREIKSTIDNVLLQLKIIIIKKGSVEAIGCYQQAKSKLSGVKQIGSVNVTNCFKNSTDDISAGIICAVNVQQTVREASQTVSVEAIKCIDAVSGPTCAIDKKNIREMIYGKLNPISKEEDVDINKNIRDLYLVH